MYMSLTHELKSNFYVRFMSVTAAPLFPPIMLLDLTEVAG